MTQAKESTRADGQLRFDGQVAIVTGAGGGIGRSHALLLASRGAKVVVNDLGGRPAEDVVAEIRDTGGEASANFADVSSEAETTDLVAQALNEFGRVDIVVNNAGGCRFRPFASMTLEEFEFELRVHVTGTFLVTKAAWPHMTERRYGRVIMTSSNGMVGIPDLSHYGAAKAGVYGLMKSLSIEGRRHGINVNALWPNATTPLSTRMFERTEEVPEELLAMDPATAKDLDGSPDHVAPVVGWLAHESCPVTGEVFHAGYGGVTRAFMAQGPCFAAPNLTIEAVAEHWPEINREVSATAMPSAAEAARYLQLGVAAALK